MITMSMMMDTRRVVEQGDKEMRVMVMLLMVMVMVMVK